MCCGGCSRVEHRLFGTGCSVGCEYWFFLLGLGRGKWRIGWVVSGTLLGPEGSGVFCSGFSVRALLAGVLLPFGVVALVCVGFRPYFENYTVDASIFVAKFLRAHGGCLGTRNRRRT